MPVGRSFAGQDEFLPPMRHSRSDLLFRQAVVVIRRGLDVIAAAIKIGVEDCRRILLRRFDEMKTAHAQKRGAEVAIARL